LQAFAPLPAGSLAVSLVEAWIAVLAGLALLPLVVTLVNLTHFRKAPRDATTPRDASDAREHTGPLPPVSVLIPARDEAEGIGACVRSVLSNTGVEFEVIVLDDHSTDGTAGVVQRLAEEDERVRLHAAPRLPEGWNGKQHACLALSRLARHDRLLWIDADVRLASDALRRTLAFQEHSGAPLVSGFPRQTAVTWMEKLIVPLIQLVLIGYLPMGPMRRMKSPGLGAGCGQMFLAQRKAYDSVGGHGAVRRSMHDGVTLPRAFRKAGYMTDLFDASDLASCRMYDSARTVWRGFAKNATEGMASPGAIGVWSVLLLGGWVFPWITLGAWFAGGLTLDTPEAWLVKIATAANLVTALIVMLKCRQTVVAAILVPLGVSLLIAIQWYALGRKLLGVPSTWRGRAYVAGQ
ncbi:MAG: glycosyltransferase, partial [Phycisphaeraceae bacterium]